MERDKAIYEAIKAGTPVSDVAAKYGLSVARVRKIYKQEHTLSWAPDFINGLIERQRREKSRLR